MSPNQQQATDATTDGGSWDFTTELTVICTVWLFSALLAGIGLVVLSTAFA